MLADGRRRISIALILGSGLILLSACVAFWLSNEQGNADSWVRHTLSVENRLNHAQVITARAEIFRRGFLLTSDTHAIGSYRAMRHEVLPELDAIAATVVDNPPQERRARALRAAVIAKLDEMRLSINLHRHGEHAAALAIMTGAESQALDRPPFGPSRYHARHRAASARRSTDPRCACRQRGQSGDCHLRGVGDRPLVTRRR